MFKTFSKQIHRGPKDMSTTNIEATASHASSQPQIEEEDLPLLRQLARLQELHDQVGAFILVLIRLSACVDCLVPSLLLDLVLN